MLKTIRLLTLCLLFASPLAAQDTYFQQKADYRIAVKLDDSRQMLLSHIDIQYTNNAPVALDRIYMHLWPNAYKNNQTVFAKAEARSGSWDFYSAPEEKRGFIDSLDFKVNGQSVRWELLPDTIDVAVLWLAKPLAPGEQLQISTPFRVKVPGNFSRLGFSREQYQLCQWYPKPAVYDQNGWHYMPYLNMGEFYSEFGDFEVFINVPSNYQVAASGNLQTASEIAYLDSLAAYAAGIDSFPALEIPESSPEFKTLHYRLENAHDFAWFCGKNYYVKQSEVVLPNSGRKVKTAVFFSRDTKYWKNAVTYVDSSVYYYSKWLGDYPYDVCTAVDGALTAGGGMEYPTITVIAGAGSARSLDLVIAHEVGHNWFYGILASNERDHPFMDEGFNSYYEERYMAKRYPGGSPNLNINIAGLDLGTKNINETELAYLLSKRRGKDVSLWHTHSTGYDGETYGTLVYKRTAFELKYLEAYLGTEAFDAMMQSYYEGWKFKHPQPSDMRQALQAAAKGKNISWWFDQRLASAGKVDYRIGRIRTTGENKYDIPVKLRGQSVPFALAALNDTGGVIRQEWYEPLSENTRISWQLDQPVHRFAIDAKERMPLYRRGLAQAKVGKFIPALPDVKGVVGLVTRQNRVFIVPTLGANYSDGFMLGLGVMSPVALPQDLEYAVLPMWSFKTGSLNGQGFVRYNWHPENGSFRRLSSGVEVLHYDNFTASQLSTNAPLFRAKLAGLFRDPLSSIRRREMQLSMARVPLNGRGFFFDTNPTPLPVMEPTPLWLFEGQYKESYRHLRTPWSWQVGAEMGFLGSDRSANSRIHGEISHRWYYQTQKRRSYLDQRVFAGVAVVNNRYNPVGFRSQGGAINGASDYSYQDIFIDRTEAPGRMAFRNLQVVYRDAGLRSVMNPFILNQLQETPATALLAYNLAVKVPKLPLELYANGVARFQSGSATVTYLDAESGIQQLAIPQFMGEAGVALTLANGAVKINANALQSAFLRPNAYHQAQSPRWFEYLSWSVDLKKLNLYDLVRNTRLG
jgi:hypothetical protein